MRILAEDRANRFAAADLPGRTDDDSLAAPARDCRGEAAGADQRGRASTDRRRVSRTAADLIERLARLPDSHPSAGGAEVRPDAAVSHGGAASDRWWRGEIPEPTASRDVDRAGGRSAGPSAEQVQPSGPGDGGHQADHTVVAPTGHNGSDRITDTGAARGPDSQLSAGLPFSAGLADVAAADGAAGVVSADGAARRSPYRPWFAADAGLDPWFTA